MKSFLPFRSAILFFGIPALWLGSASIAGRVDPALGSEGLTFIPVAVHASYAANYSLDKSIRFTPFDSDIVNDAQGDQPTGPWGNGGYFNPQSPTERDSGSGDRGTTSTQTTGNKDKSASSPGHSGDEHGNGNGKK